MASCSFRYSAIATSILRSRSSTFVMALGASFFVVTFHLLLLHLTPVSPAQSRYRKDVVFLSLVWEVDVEKLLVFAGMAGKD